MNNKLNIKSIDLNSMLIKTWNNFISILPSIFISIVIFILGIFVIRNINKLVQKIIEKNSKDQLITDFLVNIISFVFTVLLILVCLSVLGWGDITNKILAGAGITTFIVGFALKDIGENFLAGILMAFRRPFHLGDLIEIDKIKGRVTRMTLRETIVKTLDGRDVFIPNGTILKNPLENYTFDKLYRDEFIIGLDYNDDTEEAIDLIYNCVNSFEEVRNKPDIRVIIHELTASTVNVRVLFWLDSDQVMAPGIVIRSKIMLKVFKTLLREGFSLPSDIIEVKITNIPSSIFNTGNTHSNQDNKSDQVS